ncbi:rhodanese [Enterobacteriaceae bacterium Kacie_13]|nr:rhodanese [Enterobacteriaceae bacterium Kacie_13]
MSHSSYVLALAPPSPDVSAAYLHSKLSFYTDAADVAADLQNGVTSIVVIDTRSAEYYVRGHVPGAVNFPHKLMTAESTRELSRDVVYVTYCDGIGCNGSTQGAYKLAKLGYHVKEMIGGLDFWIRDKHPLAMGEERGNYSLNLAPEDCGCA